MPSEFHRQLREELERELGSLAAQEQLRSLEVLRGVNLCSNDYLGLAGHAALKDAVAEAAESCERIGGTGSRLLSGHDPAWSEAEEEFARFAGTESALYFGSGYAANLGVLTSLLGKEDAVFSDELNHASLIDGMRLSGARKHIYPHLDLDALERQLCDAPAAARKLIVTETVFSMNGDAAPLNELLALADRYGAGLILDEAHATAVHGPSGRGMAAAAGCVDEIVAVIHTCGKALASAGAFVCGSGVLKRHLVNRARTFIFTTALPAYIAAQIRCALRMALRMDSERAELAEKAAWFARALRAEGWDTAGTISQIVPVIVGDNASALAAAGFLRREGFAVRAIRPPTVPEGTARLRFSLTAAISRKELEQLVDALGLWRAQAPRLAAVGCA